MAPRRSDRRRRPNTLYADSADLSFLDVDSGGDSSDEKTAARESTAGVVESGEDDEDFELAASEAGDDAAEGLSGEDEGSTTASASSNANGGGAQPSSELLGNAFSSNRRLGERRLYEDDDIDVSEGYSQAIYTANKDNTRDVWFRLMNGQDSEESKVFERMMDKFERDRTIPSCSTAEDGQGGMCHTPLVPRHEQQEDDQNIIWFSRLITSKRFMQAQELSSLGADLADTLSRPRRDMTFVVKPTDDQELFNIPASTPKHLKELWPSHTSLGKASGFNNMRHGWLLNLGENVHCTSWMPTNGDDVQYLAVGCRPNLVGNQSPRADEETKSVFAPGKPETSCIDLWGFGTNTHDIPGVVTMPDDQPPRRLLALYASFGFIRDFKWCPVPVDSNKGGPFGLLATLHDDGMLRIFALDLPARKDEQTTQFMCLRRGSFESRPANTVCTCIEWISPYLIAAGCADGHLAVWDIKAYYDAPSSAAEERPFYFTPIHATYVLSISPCSPSKPHLIFSTAQDGNWSVTDLREPIAEQADGQRSRIPSEHIVWNEWAQGAMLVDEQPNLRFGSHRHVCTTNKLAHVEASVTSIAVSPIHCSVIVGSADGVATVMNPARIWWKHHRKLPSYRQTWFKHEWRPGRPPSADGEDGWPELDYANGLARLSTGFKLDETFDIHRKSPNKSRRKSDFLDSIQGTVIHDKATAVKAISWNPNLCAGGWAAAGMGDGLLWVEDIAWS